MTGKELLDFLKNNKDMSRKEQMDITGYASLLDLVNAIAEANTLFPDFWNDQVDDRAEV